VRRPGNDRPLGRHGPGLVHLVPLPLPLDLPLRGAQLLHERMGAVLLQRGHDPREVQRSRRRHPHHLAQRTPNGRTGAGLLETASQHRRPHRPSQLSGRRGHHPLGFR